jgi:iron complex transport system substrate-binding protein
LAAKSSPYRATFRDTRGAFLLPSHDLEAGEKMKGCGAKPEYMGLKGHPARSACAKRLLKEYSRSCSLDVSFRGVRRGERLPARDAFAASEKADDEKSAFFLHFREAQIPCSTRKQARRGLVRQFALVLGLLTGLASTPLFSARADAQSTALGSGVSSLKVTDETGRVVEMPEAAHRIVSIAPSLTETLFALGLGDRVVGDTNYCDYPAQAREKPHVGGPVNPNIEQIAALHPDLVLATRAINRPATVHLLERLGIPVYATDPRTVEQVINSTKRLGELLGAGERGETLIANLQQRLNDLGRRLSGVEPATVLVVIWLDPLISVGRHTFLADALRLAGARSIIDASQDWPNVNLEEVVRRRPEYLIFSSDDPEQVRRQVRELRDRPGWRLLDAVRRDRLIVLSEAISLTSPRLIDATEQLARALHPAQFAFCRPLQIDAAAYRCAPESGRDFQTSAARRP